MSPRPFRSTSPGIAARLNTINPLAAGMTAKRLANIRSDFLAAAKVLRCAAGHRQQELEPRVGKAV